MHKGVIRLKISLVKIDITKLLVRPGRSISDVMVLTSLGTSHSLRQPAVQLRVRSHTFRYSKI
jgi:hypothetical protein